MPLVCRVASWQQSVVRHAWLPLVLLACLPDTATAQASKEKKWGVGMSFTPAWTANQDLQTKLYWGPEPDEWPLHEGSELTVGIVRGSPRGGEWSVSYVRKPLENQTFSSTESSTSCSGPNNAFCNTFASTTTSQSNDVYVEGVEYTAFIPFVRFAAERVQIGVNVGGGAGFPKGTVTETNTFTSTFTQPGRPPQVFTDTFTDEVEAGDSITGPVVPLINAEVQAALLLGRGFKVNVAGGLNAPSAFAFRIGFSYLIGAR